MLILVIIIISFYYFFAFHNSFAIKQDAYQHQDDFVLEAHNISTNPIVTKFLVRDEIYEQICSKGQCSIEYDPNSSITFSLPDDNYPFMYHSFQFTINYNNLSNFVNDTNNETVKKLKGHSIKFLSGESTCHIDSHKSIVNKEQQIYYCEDDGIDTSITRVSDNKKWYYDAIEKYDVELDMFTLNGTLRKIQ
jgi:hypothetical protein